MLYFCSIPTGEVLTLDVVFPKNGYLLQDIWKIKRLLPLAEVFSLFYCKCLFMGLNGNSPKIRWKDVF